MPMFTMIKKPFFSSMIRTSKTKSLSEIYQWDFEIKKTPIPKIVLLNNMSLNPEYTYENYYKRHLEALPSPPEFGYDAEAVLAGEPKKTESLSVLDIRTKPDVIDKWVGTPKGQHRKEWFRTLVKVEDTGI